MLAEGVEGVEGVARGERASRVWEVLRDTGMSGGKWHGGSSRVESHRQGRHHGGRVWSLLVVVC